MRSFLFLPLISSLCAAIAVQSNDIRITWGLAKRVGEQGQRATNPDNEPDDEDPVTKSKTPKSRVLEIDEPKEAKDRWFDWDETCTDELDRQKTTAAFQDALDLAQFGSGHLQQLLDNLPKKPPESSAKKENVAFIVKEDPAFAQMFFAQDNRIGYVKETYDLLLSKMKSFDGRNGNNPNGLRFICDKEGNVKNAKGESYCGTGDTAAQAITNNAANHDVIENKYSFEKSASIVFCPPFFDDRRFPNIWAVASSNDAKTLDKVDCRERIMLHEWLHLKFTRNIDTRIDEIGFE
ncbi:MAG: hypothetical protein Q9160_004121 [Pyrenula sp. 1 TL-2023]